MKDAAVIDRQLKALKPFNRKCKLEISGGINRLPMERSAGVAGLYKKAFEIAKELNWKLEEASVGGGSDGNFTASLGIPTLDGLGGVGEGAHAKHESIILAELPRRAALLARSLSSRLNVGASDLARAAVPEANRSEAVLTQAAPRARGWAKVPQIVPLTPATV